jgi:hypothetical protein
MTAPTVRAFSTPNNSTDAAPAFTVNAPAGVATGDLLLAFAVNDTTTTAWTASPGNGWVQLSDEVQGSTHRLAVYALIADGSDTLSIAAANNQDYSVVMMAITVGTHAVVDVSTDIVIPAAATSATGNADPPASGTVASADWLAIAACGTDFTNAGDAISAAPTNYTTGAILTKSAASTSSVGLGVGHRALTAATSEDPGTFTNTSRPWVAKTLLIPPFNPNGTATPAVIATAASIPAATPQASKTVEPAVIPTAATIPAATASGGGGGGGITTSLVTSADDGWNTAEDTGFVTASIAPGADCALVLLIGGVAGGTGNLDIFDNTSTCVSSGSGPTWTKQEWATYTGTFQAQAAIWTAVIGGSDPGSFTVTFDFGTGSRTAGLWAYSIHKCTGHDTSTTFGGKETTSSQAGNGAVTITLDAAPATDDVTIALSVVDTDASGTGATFGTSFGTWTETVEGDGTDEVGWNTGWRTASTSTSVEWTDVNTGSATNFTSAQAAIVVKAAAGGGGDDTATPDVIVTAATIPAASTAGGATAVPAVTALTATIPAATRQGGGDATPAVITTAVTFDPASVGGSVTTDVIALTVTIPQATATGGGSATATPTVINIPVTIPAATPQASKTVAPAVIPLAVSEPAPTVSGAGNVTPAVIPTAATLPAPTASGAGNVTPTVTTLTVTMPAATATGAGNVSPAVIPLAVTIPQASASGANPGTATPAVTTLTVTMPAATAQAGTVTSPAVTTLAVTMPQTVASGSRTIDPAVIPLTVSLPAATASGATAGTATPNVIATVTVIPSPTLLYGYVVNPAAIQLAVAIAAAVASGTPPDLSPVTVTLTGANHTIIVKAATHTIRMRGPGS